MYAYVCVCVCVCVYKQYTYTLKKLIKVITVVMIADCYKVCYYINAYRWVKLLYIWLLIKETQQHSLCY